MSQQIKGRMVWYAAVGVLALAVGSGCNKGAETPTPVAEQTSGPVLGAGLTGSPEVTSPPQPGNGTSTTKPPAAPTWPSPEDCVSYNPQNLTVQYEAGIYTVSDGSKVVMRLSGGPGEVVGDQGLALAKRYSKHCYLGRTNNREEKNSYIFDYWRNSTGATTTIADEEDACSGYNRNNLTVEDMGDGNGWRVKDHDHVLHLFDNQSDARNGKLVLAKYSQICFLGNNGDTDPEVVSYLR